METFNPDPKPGSAARAHTISSLQQRPMENRWRSTVVVFENLLRNQAKTLILVFRFASSGKLLVTTRSRSYAIQMLIIRLMPWPVLRNAFTMLKNWV